MSKKANGSGGSGGLVVAGLGVQTNHKWDRKILLGRRNVLKLIHGDGYTTQQIY